MIMLELICTLVFLSAMKGRKESEERNFTQKKAPISLK